jgi:hypothetical protein
MLGRMLGLSLGISIVGISAGTAADYSNPNNVYQALIERPGTDIPAQQGTIHLTFADPASPERAGVVVLWLKTAQHAVEIYFGRFPVEKVGVLVLDAPGNKTAGGTTWGFAGPAMVLRLGRDATVETLANDWQLVHEFTHLSLPQLDRQHHWLEEGVATYVEPIARVQAGQLAESQVWRDMIRDLPQGLPQPGDQGLDRTHTWARTYWGGALFCFVVDVEIRRRTHNRAGLQTALRAIDRESKGHGADWSIDQVIASGDHATGVPVLRETYNSWKWTPVSPDLNRLFLDLGIGISNGELKYDETAPLAEIRHAIMSAP